MAERLAVEDFHQFGGKHCQTTALKNILDKVYVSDRGEKPVAVTIEDLQKKDLTSLLEELKQKILGCHQIEEKAFKILSNMVK